MEKFSLFDLLSIAVPGGTALCILLWGMAHSIPFKFASIAMPDTLLIFLLLMLSYLAGHLVNDAAIWLERRLGGLPKSWVTILANNPDLSGKLNIISQKTFGFPILTPEGQVDPEKSGLFYDYAFNTLEVAGKIEKVRILQSQYAFLRNVVALAIWGLVVFGTVLYVQLVNGNQWYSEVPIACMTGILIFVVLAWVSRRLATKRRYFKMSATLQNFYAFYLLEHKLSPTQ